MRWKMRNTIKYYYGLDIANIHQNEKTYYFTYNNYNYIFLKYNYDIEEAYKISIELRNIKVHEIVLNNNNSPVTKINNENYVLLKIYVKKAKININDIILFNNINYQNSKLKNPSWYSLWTNKIDYFEYQVNQMGKKYPLITQSFSYYVGLAENAISLISNIGNIPLSLSHKRILSTDTTYELYNPLNIIIDYRIRDVCEYFKSSFFHSKNTLNEVKSFLFYNPLSYDEACYFFSRLLFPTYYFDIYEKIINNEILEKYLENIISRVDDYEIFLKEIYSILKSNHGIPNIDWLN